MAITMTANNASNIWEYKDTELTLGTTGSYLHTLKTAGTYLDRNIQLNLTPINGAISVAASVSPGATVAKTSDGNVIASNATTSKPTSGYYVAVKGTSVATSITLTPTITTAGWIGSTNRISLSGTTTAASGSVYYVPIQSAVFNNVSTDSSSTDAVPLVTAVGYTPVRYLTALTVPSGKKLSTLTNSGTITTLTNTSGTISTLSNGTITTLAGSQTITNITGTKTITNLGTSAAAGILNITNNGVSSSYKSTISVTANTYGTINAWGGKTKDKGVSIEGHVVTVDGDGTNAGTSVTNTNGDLITTSVSGAGGAVTATAGASIATTPVVTPSIGGTILNAATITTTAPSTGTNGTDYFILDPGGSVTTTGVATGTANASTTAVTYTNTAGWLGAHSTATELFAGKTATQSSKQVNITPTIAAGTNYYLPITTLTNSIISSQSNANGTTSGVDSVKITVTIPAGYHKEVTLEKTFSDLLPNLTTDAGAGHILNGYQAYTDEGKLVTGTMPNNGAVTGAKITMTKGNGNVTGSNVTLSTTNSSGISVAGKGYLTASYTIPAGYHNGSGTVTGSSTVSNTETKYITDLTVAADKTLNSITTNAVGSGTAAGKITTVTNNGTIGTLSGNGVISTMSGTQTISNLTGQLTITKGSDADTNTAGSNGKLIIGSTTIMQDGTLITTSAGKSNNTISWGTGWINAGSLTVGAGSYSLAISGTPKVTPAISKVSVATGVTDAADGAATTTAPSSGVYVAVQSAAASNTLTPTTAITTGYITTGQAATSTSTVAAGANASAVTYVKIKTASPAFDGGGLSSKKATASAANMTIGTTDTYSAGITVTASAKATRDAVLYNGAVDGWVTKADNTTALSATSSQSWTGTTYYLTSLTIPASKTFGSASTNAITINGTAYVGVVGSETIKFPTSGSGSVTIVSTEVAKNGALITTSASKSGAVVSWGTGWITAGSHTIAKASYSLSTSSSSGDGKVTPSISRVTGNGTAGGKTIAVTATTAEPSTGYYIAVQSAAAAKTITPTITVASAGYIASATDPAPTAKNTISVGANASSITYLPLAASTQSGALVSTTDTTTYPTGYTTYTVTTTVGYNAEALKTNVNVYQGGWE